MPIDGTDIIRSILAIGREPYFPIYININALPTMTPKKSQATLDYLNFIDSSRHFSSSILKIFIEDRRTVHADRINNNRIIGVLQTGNIVMVRTVIHSDISKNKVFNLSYAVRGPCRIIRIVFVVVVIFSKNLTKLTALNLNL